MSLDLVILEGPEAGKRIPVANAPITLGRAPAAALTFPDDGFISSVHISIQADPGGVRITDLRSTNGTFLNGERITSAVADVGDVIQIGTMTMQVMTSVHQASPPASAAPLPPVSATAGKPPEATMIGTPALPAMDIPAPPPMSAGVGATTTIPRINVKASSQLPRLDTVKKAPVASQPMHLTVLSHLAKLHQPLFVMLNAAADDSIPAILVMGDVDLPKHCLWQDEGQPAAPRWAPYLIQAAPGSQLLSVLLERGWGKNWLSVFASNAPLEELRSHFGKFLKVQMAQTGGIYFRFYDPQVLREFLPSGNAAEIAMFFGPVEEWWLEAENKNSILHARNTAEGLKTETIPLAGNDPVSSTP